MRLVRGPSAVLVAVLVTAALGTGSAGATVIGTAHGIKYVKNTMNVLGAGSNWSDAINCGADYQPLSGGTFSTGFSDARMTTSSFGSFHTNWTSAGWNVGFGKNISTLALCRKTAAAVNYVTKEVTVAAGTTTSPTIMSANAPCPAKTVIASGGVRIGGDVSTVHVSGFHPVKAFELWRVTVANEGAERNITVGAVCVPPGLGLTYYKSVFTDAPANPNGFLARPSCLAAGEVPIAGGGMWSGNQDRAHIATAGPIDSSGNVNSVPDYAWQVGAANDSGAAKDFTGFAICKPA
ncbi:MAG: hypothetical protein ACJ75I_09915 [Solirubrobacterales bacterium]